MRVFGVVDLLDGQAVHAAGGHRDCYAPLQVSGGVAIGGDAIALARAYSDRFGITAIYLADLDAIVHHTRQDPLIANLVAMGTAVWLDAGTTTVDDARAAVELGATRVIVGLETLSSFDALARICAALGSDRVAFSLDLHQGIPMVATGGIAAGETPEVLAARAVDAGASAVTLIDLARIGSRRGVDPAMLARVRDAIPGATLVSGGGIRNLADIERLEAAGCDGVLVATALHNGDITPTDLLPYSDLHHPPSSTAR